MWAYVTIVPTNLTHEPEFDFSVSPVNQGLVRELHEGGFLATQRNAVLIGGPAPAS